VNHLKKGKFRYAYHSFEPASLYSEMVARRLLDLGSGLGIFMTGRKSSRSLAGRRGVEHQPTGPLRGPQDSERLTVSAVVPRAAEAVDVVWISVPHADEITGACDLEVDLDDGIWHRAPLAVDDFGEHSKPLPWQTENSRVAFRGAIAGEELAEHVLGRTAFTSAIKALASASVTGRSRMSGFPKSVESASIYDLLHRVQFPRPQQAYACSWDKPNA
jgi:hypothetical protein